MDGILLVDKPAGMTSRAVDDAVRRRLGRAARVGHVGTLDPFATGLLPILVGEATKLSPYLVSGEKTYVGRLALGVATTTGDPDGTVIGCAPVPTIDSETVGKAMQKFTGSFEQRVPTFSAVKVGGIRLYQRARRGETVEPPVRAVFVRAWRLLAVQSSSIDFEVVCSAGTYVRTLGEQLAQGLGTLGHLASLRRVRLGRLEESASVSLVEALDRMPLLPMAGVLDWPVRQLDAEEEVQLRCGQPITAGSAPLGTFAQAISPTGRLVALLRRDPPAMTGGRWRVLRGFLARHQS